MKDCKVCLKYLRLLEQTETFIDIILMMPVYVFEYLTRGREKYDFCCSSYDRLNHRFGFFEGVQSPVEASSR